MEYVQHRVPPLEGTDLSLCFDKCHRGLRLTAAVYLVWYCTSHEAFEIFRNERISCQYCRTVKVKATEPLYIRATFPPLRHSFIQRHQCIHRLINHVYTKDQALSYSLPHDMVAARIKHWDLRNISLGCVTCCQSIGRVERSSLRDCLFTLRLPLFPSCGTSVPVSGGHCITVSKVQQEDCDKGHIQYQVVCFRLQ